MFVFCYAVYTRVLVSECMCVCVYVCVHVGCVCVLCIPTWKHHVKHKKYRKCLQYLYTNSINVLV